MNIQIANYAIAMSSVLTWEVCGHREKLLRLGPQAAVPLHDMVPYTRSGPWSTQRSLHSVRFFSQLRGTCCPLFFSTFLSDCAFIRVAGGIYLHDQQI
jgi:hypothetical protein